MRYSACLSNFVARETPGSRKKVDERVREHTIAVGVFGGAVLSLAPVSPERIAEKIIIIKKKYEGIEDEARASRALFGPLLLS